jgi:hypothetical protein
LINKFRINSANLKFPNNQLLCKDFLTGYTLSNAIVYATGSLILVLNIVIVAVLKRLSQFQRFHTKTEEKASSIVKMFLIQLINTGIVILLVNARIQDIALPSFIPLFQGKYEDFTVEWYRVVGSTISFTMLINIASPHAEAFVKMFVGSLKRCIDRGCGCDMAKTKYLLQEDYELSYTGPEFLIEVRYSQILASFYIMMFYSSGMPILYVIGLCQFFLTYWVDKLLFLRFYKTPPRYGIEMTEITR